MIYYAQEAGNQMAPIKIGFTDRDPLERLAQFQTGYPGKLCILYSRTGDPKDEAAEHEKWKHLHIHGEWFRPAPELVTYILRAARAVERTIDEARDVALLSYAPPVHSTGLRKRCPRCGRDGWIFVLEGTGDRAIVVWDGPARWSQHYGRPEVDIDSCDIPELFDSQFGCGSEPPEKPPEKQKPPRANP